MSIQIDSTQSKAGGTSLLIPGGTNATATQSITGLKANRVYLAQCWIKTDGNVLGSGSYGAGMWGTVDSGTLQTITTTGSSHGFGTAYFDVELAATGATDWTLLQSVFQSSADCTLTLHLQNGVGGGSVGAGNTWVDLVSVTDVSGQIAPAVAASTSVAQQNSGDYLTNSDKASLLQQYKAELQTKVQLDSQASAAGVSATSYDNAVAAISSTLTGAGAPANWASAWPDGSTSGPWSGIKANLAGAWANVALYRATLQNAISSAQAASAQSAAINAAATDAANKMAVAATITVASLPTLPNSSYPVGKLVWNSADGKLYRNSGGSWVLLSVDGSNIAADSLTANQIAAGAIGASEIAAGAITASKLAITDATNLCSNPNGDSGSDGWDSNVTAVPAPILSNAKALLQNNRDCFCGSTFPVVVGDMYRVTFDSCPDGWGTPPSGGFTVGMEFIDANGNYISWVPSVYASTGNTGAWTTSTGTVTVPSGAASARIWSQIIATAGSTGNWYFRRVVINKMANGSLIVDGTITATKLNTNAIQTTNYVEDGSGNPTAGAKMQTSGTALKVASGNLQIGSYTFADWMLPRIAQALDGNSANGVIFYRGNIDTTYRGGAPNINCLAIQCHAYERVNSNFQHGYWTYTIAPTSYSTLTDNLDALRALRIRFFQTTSSYSPFQDVWFPITDRLYDGSTGAIKGSFSWGWREGTDNAPSANLSNGSSPYLFNGYIRATLYNAYGASADADFGPNNTAGGNLPATTITGQAGSTTASGSGTAGGACPAPWLLVSLASGLTVPAGSLYDGAEVVGIDEGTSQPAKGIIRNPQRIWSRRVPITLDDGRVLEYSLHHRKLVDRGWVAVEDLRPGETLLGSRPGVIKSVGAPHLAEVIDFIVDGCHTYETNGTLDHNSKIAPNPN